MSFKASLQAADPEVVNPSHRWGYLIFRERNSLILSERVSVTTQHNDRIAGLLPIRLFGEIFLGIEWVGKTRRCYRLKTIG
jgi:hypothetical protein